MFIAIGSAVDETIRNHMAWLPDKTDNVNGVYHHLKDCKLAVPTDKLRLLNKACLLHGTKEDAPCNGSDAATSSSTTTTGRGCARCTRWSSSSRRSASWT
ncbi:unnamed protein product [Miscanthus lutarioriparius]|uniref:Uncharacterized protein n=1 Tax=Miscanthus lutarioriparius TaxID=422564 RepID=A0A811N032_9POAL|nr:unnamed protein product [Miscanthus lutarioriparius]